jgi:hypothetical protein
MRALSVSSVTRRVAAVVVLLTGLAAPAVAQQLKPYRNQYYEIRSDMDAATVREALLRSDLMARAYARRTEGFARRLTARMPLYLYRNAEDYYRAGAVPGSAGSFVVDRDGKGKLLVLAGPQVHAGVWMTMQHEGFHQFVHAVIGDVPVWVNEGLAEYFGEGLFTGDDYLTGVVRPERLAELRGYIRGARLRPFMDLMRTNLREWNNNLSTVNYTQAWSMVHFLAHGSPRYQKAFGTFLSEISRGVPWERAWTEQFGGDVSAFERAWRDYWEKMSPDESADLYRKALVLTMTSYYGRAFSQRQNFTEMSAFFDAARQGKLRAHAEDWLPPSLLETRLPIAERMGQWWIDPQQPRSLYCQVSEETTLMGTFQVERGRIKQGSVRVRVMAAAPARRR